MAYEISTWIDHPLYGLGQIKSEFSGKAWVIRFASGEERKILKTAILLEGQPPSPEFAFAKTGSKAKKAAKKSSNSMALSFPHLLERFLAAYPGGVDGEFFDTDERRYKAEAAALFSTRLNEKELKSLVESEAFDVIAARALELLKATNLVFHIEAMRFRDGLKTDEGKRLFATGLYDHLYGTASEEERFNRYLQILGQLQALSWPMATYFHFLSSGGEAMFMKPTVSQRIAQAVGVALNYKPRAELAHIY